MAGEQEPAKTKHKNPPKPSSASDEGSGMISKVTLCQFACDEEP